MAMTTGTRLGYYDVTAILMRERLTLTELRDVTGWFEELKRPSTEEKQPRGG